jgi:hypothetical protein
MNTTQNIMKFCTQTELTRYKWIGHFFVAHKEFKNTEHEELFSTEEK